MQRAMQWLGVMLVVACCAPWRPTSSIGGQSQEAMGRSANGAEGEWKVAPGLSGGELYRQVKPLVESTLRPQIAGVWKDSTSSNQAWGEFRGFQERVQSMEDVSAVLPINSPALRSRMFAAWNRVSVGGQALPSETEAALGARGGPESEVVLGTGELLLEQMDASLPERSGIGFKFVRYYRSGLDYDGPLGPGWDHNCNQRIVADGLAAEPQQLVYFTGEKAIRFDRRGDRWEPEPGAFYRLTLSKEKIVVETPDLKRLTFESSSQNWLRRRCWRIAEVAGRHGQAQANVMKFRYWPGSDVLMLVETPHGDRVRFFHDMQGRLVALQCANLAVLYEYDPQGRLSHVRTPSVATRLAQTQDIKWQYSYEVSGDGRHWLRSLIPPGGFMARVYQYEATPEGPSYRRVVRVIHQDRAGGVKVGDSDIEWRFTYKLENGQYRVSYRPPAPLAEEQWTFAAGGGSTQCYPLERSIPARNATWRWKHNQAGQPLEEVRPLGGVVRWEYDSGNADPRFRGNLLSKREFARPSAKTWNIAERGWEWTYHPQIALPIRIVVYQVDGQRAKQILQTTDLQYDANDLDLIEEHTGQKGAWVVRNRFGLPVVQVDGRGCATVYRYYSAFREGKPSEASGGLLAEAISDASQADIAAALQVTGAKAVRWPLRQAEGQPCRRVCRYLYDPLGRTTDEEYPGRRVGRVWNKLGQLLAVLESQADLVVYDYDGGLRRVGESRRILRLQGAQYLGERRADATGLFAIQELAYDPFGRLTTWKLTREGFGPNRAEVPVIRYEYCPSGLLKKRTTVAGTAVEIEYDPNTGHQVAIYLRGQGDSEKADAARPLVLRKDMTYDAEGFQVLYYDARGVKHVTEPDGFGRPFATVWPNELRVEEYRDGLDRVVTGQWSRQDRQSGNMELLLGKSYEYDLSGRLVRVKVQYTSPAEHNPQAKSRPDSGNTLSEPLIAEENQYDAEGNLVAHRSFREGAWQRFGYDGLGRVVWREEPSGDLWQGYYEGDFLCVETQRFNTIDDQNRPTRRALHSVILRDDRGQPWCTIPVGQDGTVGMDRAMLTEHDTEGRVVLEVAPNLRRKWTFYNTLDQPERELVEDLTNVSRRVLSREDRQYAPDGLLIRREVYNEPLVFVALNGDEKEEKKQLPLARAERRPVPQVQQLTYDAFRRLQKEALPDGQVQEFSYDSASMVRLLTRYATPAVKQESVPERKETLQFAYDEMARLTHLKDAAADRIIQEFQYDLFDNIIKATDYCQQEHPICVDRVYDSLGQLLKETVNLPKDGLNGDVSLAYRYDLPQGKLAAYLEGLTEQPAGWRTLEVEQDLGGRVATIRKDGNEFCGIDWLGQQEVRRRFGQYQTEEIFSGFNPFLEPTVQWLVAAGTPQQPGKAPAGVRDGGTGDLIYEMHYLRDPLGRIAASSVRVPQKDWECSQFYDRDPAGNISAEDMQARFYPPQDLQRQREEVLQVGRPAGPGREEPGLYLAAYHVHRYDFDQAGSRMASYRGPASNVWPKGAELASASEPIKADLTAGPLQSGAHIFPIANRASNVNRVNTLPEAGPSRQMPNASEIPESHRWALASNRTACKATALTDAARLAAVRTRYQYDGFGRLEEYDSQSTGETLHWKIEYDLLGRVSIMKGYAPGETPDKAVPKSTLVFAYDPFNRRIIKKVRPREDQGKTSTLDAMIYMNQRPAVKLRKQGDRKVPWSIEGQYIWGAGPSKVLAYYSRTASSGEEPEMRECLLHQDLALNVFLGTRATPSHENPTALRHRYSVLDVASYWGTGQNSTTAVIQEVECSLKAEKQDESGTQAKRQWSIDRLVDARADKWFGSDDRGFLTLHLAETHRLSGLSIWAGSLPEHFRVYVVQAGDTPRSNQSLAAWEEKHASNRVGDFNASNAGENPSPNPTERPNFLKDPLTLSLGNREGAAVVFLWDRTSNWEVREFELFVEPERPSDLAFSGSVYDAETGLYYHGARYRLPELGTFISPDPLGFFAGNNLYAFANNDPLTWHDPDGKIAHVILGALAGGVFGAATYVFDWWWYGEEWSWAKFAVHTGAGALAGAVAAVAGPLLFESLSQWGLSTTIVSMLSAGGASASGGAFRGAILGGGLTYLDTGDLREAGWGAFRQAAIEAGLGAIGGAIGGAVPGKIGASFWGFLAGGAVGGASVGALVGAYEGYQATGGIRGAAVGFAKGAVAGAFVGGALGAASWGVGRATGLVRPLPPQPEGLPDPRTKGILMRTPSLRNNSVDGKVNYGGMDTMSGYARHHIKPLVLGGTDTPDNIELVPMEIHRQAHPGPAVLNAPIGTIFY